MKWVNGQEFSYYFLGSDEWSRDKGGWSLDQYIESGDKCWKLFEKPEAQKTQEWDGTGLPPVGTECEVVIGALKPRTVCFVGIKSSGSVVIETVDGEFKSYHRSQVNFRPIPTQAQIDRTQLVKTLNQLRGETDVGVIADAIIELGFTLKS